MSLLTLLQEVARRIPVAVPSTIVNNNETTALLLLSCAREEAEQLARAPDNGWTILQREHTFTTVNGTASYSLPSDFRDFIDRTLWNRTDFDSLRAGLTPMEWQARKSSILNSSPLQDGFRIKPTSGTNEFFIDPTPSAAENFVFEYISKNWAEDSGGTGKSDFTVDSDELRLDEFLFKAGVKWRVLERLGMPYFEARDIYDRELSKAISRDGTAPILSLVKRPTGPNLLGPENVPDTGFG